MRSNEKDWPTGAVVLLTGASSGLGQELFVQLSDFDAEVHLILHPRHDGENSSQLLRSKAASIAFCDLADPEATAVAAKTIVKKAERLDTLIVCAASAAYGSIGEVPWNDVRNVMNVNYLSNVILVGECLPLLRRQPVAHIVGIGSGSALMGLRFGSPYHASKASLQSFFESLYGECYGSTVRVTHLMPGYMDTPFHTKQRRYGKESVPPTGKAIDLRVVANSIIRKARTRQGNVLVGRNPRIAYHLRYWCPPLLRRLVRRYGY